MTPTIGRIVHYRPTSEDVTRYGCNGRPFLPAVVVAVWSDTCVNLKVLNDGPTDFWRTSVGIGSNEPGTWSWPERVS